MITARESNAPHRAMARKDRMHVGRTVWDLVCCRGLERAVLFRWAFEDKDVEELINAGNADVARTSEWGVKEGDATTIFCTCRRISSQPLPSKSMNDERNTMTTHLLQTRTSLPSDLRLDLRLRFTSTSTLMAEHSTSTPIAEHSPRREENTRNASGSACTLRRYG